MKKIDKPEFVLREYVKSLSVDELKSIYDRLVQNFAGDMSEVLQIFAKHPGVDRILSSAQDVREFYTMLDEIRHYIERDLSNRGFSIELCELIR